MGDASDCGGSTALHLAARHGYGKVVCQLIAAGAEVNPKDSQKRIPLHFAAEGHYNCCRALLLNGAKENATDRLGRTPLMYAARFDLGPYQWYDYPENQTDDLKDVVWLLLKHGANTNIKDSCYNTVKSDGANEKCLTAIENFLMQ